MRTRFVVFIIVLALGAAGTWQILASSQPAAIVFGAAMLLLSLSVFSRGRKSGSTKNKSQTKLPPHAIALRQSRALTRAEEGEISGVPSSVSGGPA